MQLARNAAFSFIRSPRRALGKARDGAADRRDLGLGLLELVLGRGVGDDAAAA
jgi:hypothetical protein